MISARQFGGRCVGKSGGGGGVLFDRINGIRSGDWWYDGGYRDEDSSEAEVRRVLIRKFVASSFVVEFLAAEAGASAACPSPGASFGGIGMNGDRSVGARGMAWRRTSATGWTTRRSKPTPFASRCSSGAGSPPVSTNGV